MGDQVSDILTPGQAILYMKVGTHAQESLDEIIARKAKEIRDAGYALWGYGGGTCHPRTMVQPFVSERVKLGHKVFLCMQEMTSKHFAEPVRAEEMSPDGIKWESIDPSINVKGSRYALVIKDLKKQDLSLPLSQTRVAIGNSVGQSGLKYIRGRVDKACFEIVGASGEGTEEDPVSIGLLAEIVEPYAVFLRNSPT